MPYVLLAAVLGPAGEALLVSLGVFDYSDPDFAGIRRLAAGAVGQRRLRHPPADRPDRAAATERRYARAPNSRGSFVITPVTPSSPSARMRGASSTVQT